MDKADIAILISSLSVVFSGWQAIAAHRSAQIAKAATKRRDPVFEITEAPSQDHPGWVNVRVVGRNFEPVEVRIQGFRYLDNLLIANQDDFAHGLPYSSDRPSQSPEEIARRGFVPSDRRIGAAGEQRTLSNAPHVPRPTAYFGLLVQGPFDPKRLKVEWNWADDVGG